MDTPNPRNPQVLTMALDHRIREVVEQMADLYLRHCWPVAVMEDGRMVDVWCEWKDEKAKRVYDSLADLLNLMRTIEDRIYDNERQRITIEEGIMAQRRWRRVLADSSFEGRR